MPARERKRPAMIGAKACLVVDGVHVAAPIEEVLLQWKYAPIVAAHLWMDKRTFSEIDWPSHARALGTERSPALTRIVWVHHPTRSHLKQTGKYPSDICPLCGEKDRSEYFLSCKTVNGNKRYQVVRDEMRHRANARGAPDHLINTMARVMTGKGANMEKIPTHARRVYKNQ